MKTMNLVLSMILLSSFGCVSKETKTTAETSKSGFQLRSYQQETLPNGLRILWIHDSSLPRVSMSLLIKVGTLYEKSGQEGLSSLTTALLDQGTMRSSATQIADDLAQIGAEYGHTAGSDQTVIGISGLSTTKNEMMKIFSDIVMSPAFSEKEIERRKSVVLALIQNQKDQPAAVASEKIQQQIFDRHPYANPIHGNEKSIKSWSRKDLIKHYYSFYRPQNSLMSVVGNFDGAFQDSVRASFGTWAGTPNIELAVASPTPREREVLFVDRAGLKQTQIRWGHLGIDRKNPDFLKLRLANVVLGGAFASRLNQKIRDDMGLTYSISSASNAGLQQGSFEIQTFTRHDKAVITVLETEKLLREFVQSGITDEELSSAKALLVGQFPAALETADKTAFNLLTLRRFDLGDDYLINFEKNVNAISKEEVNQVIQKYVHPDKLQLVIYSDLQQMGPELEKLGPMKKVKFE